MLKTGFMDDEKLFTVELTESELCQVVTALWLLERENVALAERAKREGNLKHERARRESASKAIKLADRLVEIGATRSLQEFGEARARPGSS